jgi:hypothetical protein
MKLDTCDPPASAVFNRSYVYGVKPFYDPVSETSESKHDEIRDFAETTRSPNPSNIGHMRPQFTCNKSWKPKVLLDEDKYRVLDTGRVALKKTNNGLKVFKARFILGIANFNQDDKTSTKGLTQVQNEYCFHAQYQPLRRELMPVARNAEWIVHSRILFDELSSHYFQLLPRLSIFGKY